MDGIYRQLAIVIALIVVCLALIEGVAADRNALKPEEIGVALAHCRYYAYTKCCPNYASFPTFDVTGGESEMVRQSNIISKLFTCVKDLINNFLKGTFEIPNTCCQLPVFNRLCKL